MKVIELPVKDLIPYVNNSRTHDDEQVAQIAASIKEWKFIGNYAVSINGEIVRLPFSCKNKWGGISKYKAKKLAQSNDKNGYKLVTAKKLSPNKKAQFRVHRLVAHCWIGECPKGYEVNHIDGNKSNNKASNLEYVTSKQNKDHAVNIGLVKIGKEHHNTKPIKLTKDGRTIIVHGCKEIKKIGLRPQSVHRVARKERKSIKGWVAEYV